MNTVIIKDGRERSLKRRHPWIFSGAVASVSGDPRRGELVDIRSAKGDFLARGAYSPDSRITVKVWTFDETEIVDENFFRRKLSIALDCRKTVFRGNLPEAYRLVNAESDGLPGLILDRYGDYGVCQLTSAGMDAQKELLAGVLPEFGFKGVYERSDVDSRKLDGMELRTGHFCGEELPELLSFRENGVTYFADPRNGHKTGFYLDQRENRKYVSDKLNGAENVLNCFCYTGGFGLSALHGGAKQVLNVDSSEPALSFARKNAECNGFAPDRFQTENADVFQFLRKCRDSRKTFDAIILDPPKFAESFQHRERAARAYKDINLLAMKLLRPGGFLFTFSCSAAIDPVLFGQIVDSAACDAGRDFRICAWLDQGPDHPVAATFPEGRYLKGIAGVVF